MPYWWTFGLFLKPYVFSTNNEVLENSWLFIFLIDHIFIQNGLLLSHWVFFALKSCLLAMLPHLPFQYVWYFFFIFELSMTFNFWYDSYRPIDFMILFNFIFLPSHLLHLLMCLDLILYLLYIFSSSCFLISFHAVCWISQLTSFPTSFLSPLSDFKLYVFFWWILKCHLDWPLQLTGVSVLLLEKTNT